MEFNGLKYEYYNLEGHNYHSLVSEYSGCRYIFWLSLRDNLVLEALTNSDFISNKAYQVVFMATIKPTLSLHSEIIGYEQPEVKYINNKTIKLLSIITNCLKEDYQYSRKHNLKRA